MPDLPFFKATVETEPTLRIIELHFFDGECDDIKRTTGFATPPSCCYLGTSVPSDAAYIMVSAQAGSGSFTLTLR